MPRIVILTGAGISAESGLPTFRAADGLWEDYRIEDVATPKAFLRDPALVHRFYNMRRAALQGVEPNAAHLAVARLQRELPGMVTLVTQNVDDLHDRAGGETIHMHGELLKARCMRCGRVFPWSGDLSTATPCPSCRTTGDMRPHIVWFGEIPLHMEEICHAAEKCDIFAAVGTSGSVYPAAGLSSIARSSGARCIEFNLVGTVASANFDEHREGPATVTVPAWVDEILAASHA
jgi:NAD-dependent deacetylase